MQRLPSAVRMLTLGGLTSYEGHWAILGPSCLEEPKCRDRPRVGTLIDNLPSIHLFPGAKNTSKEDERSSQL